MKIFKVFTVAGLLLFLVLHTSFTLLYVLPGDLIPSCLATKSKKYMDPLFEQGWGLFAPVPNLNKKIYISYLENAEWSRWEAPFDKYLEAHRSTRVTADARIVLFVSTALHYLQNENREGLERDKNIIGNNSSQYFNVLKYALKKELMHRYISAKKIKLLVVYSKVSCGEKELFTIYYPEFEISK